MTFFYAEGFDAPATILLRSVYCSVLSPPDVPEI